MSVKITPHKFSVQVISDSISLSAQLDSVAKSLKTFPDHKFFNAIDDLSTAVSIAERLRSAASELHIQPIESGAKTIRSKLILAFFALAEKGSIYAVDSIEVINDTQADIEALVEIAKSIISKNKPDRCFYYIEFDQGCAIKLADSFADAHEMASKIAKSRKVDIALVEIATKENIDWFISMGGTLPNF